jgi:hypothetical protein
MIGLDKYLSTGYYLSHPIRIRGFVGIKLKTNFISNDYILENYLKVEESNPSNKVVTHYSVPLLNDYSISNQFSLYFINRITRLPFYPSDDFKLYKDGVELQDDGDYHIFTSSDSTLVTTIPEPDPLKGTTCYIQLTNFSPTSHYIAVYTPRSDVPVSPIGPSFKINGSELTTSRLSTTVSSIYLFSVVRQITSAVNYGDLPIYANYSLELNYESE